MQGYKGKLPVWHSDTWADWRDVKGLVRPETETVWLSDFAVRELGTGYAVVTGRFHLARNAAGGGDASGIFSLIWEKTPQGWKIILDHSNRTN